MRTTRTQARLGSQHQIDGNLRRDDSSPAAARDMNPSALGLPVPSRCRDTSAACCHPIGCKPSPASYPKPCKVTCNGTITSISTRHSIPRKRRKLRHFCLCFGSIHTSALSNKTGQQERRFAGRGECDGGQTEEMRAPGMHLPGDGWQVLQRTVPGNGENAGHRLPVWSPGMYGRTALIPDRKR